MARTMERKTAWIPSQLPDANKALHGAPLAA